MQEEVMLSVSLITYNQKNYIAQTIEGVLRQKVDFKYEIIIGDDCSTDGTREILLEFQKRFPNLIKLILHPKRNDGIPGKLNFVSTIYAAQGKYVALLDGDDYWTDELKLQKQVNFLEANPDFAVCFHRVERHYEGQDIPSELSNPDQKSVTTFEDLAGECYISAVSCVYRNGLFEKLPDWFYQLKMGDWVLHLLNAQHGKIKFLEDTMAVYRVHRAGEWSKRTGSEQMKSLAEAIEIFLVHFSPKGEKGFKKLGGYLLSELCYTAFEEGAYAEGRDYCKKALGISDYLPLRKKISLRTRYLLCTFPIAAEFYKAAVKNIRRQKA